VAGSAIATVAAARAFVRRHRVVALGASPWVPSLSEAIAGAPIRGSWWAHPKGKLIFACASALEDSPDLLTLKLLDCKVTFVHRSLWRSGSIAVIL